MGKSEYTEEQVREAFKLGQQWFKDINDGNQPLSLNEWLSGQDSHSPTEPDTLIEGDWFQGTEEEYRKVLDIYGSNPDNPWLRKMIKYGFCVYTEDDNALGWENEFKKTQLTAPEFIRRAENTFKTK